MQIFCNVIQIPFLVTEIHEKNQYTTQYHNSNNVRKAFDNIS